MKSVLFKSAQTEGSWRSRRKDWQESGEGGEDGGVRRWTQKKYKHKHKNKTKKSLINEKLSQKNRQLVFLLSYLQSRTFKAADD